MPGVNVPEGSGLTVGGGVVVCGVDVGVNDAEGELEGTRDGVGVPVGATVGLAEGEAETVGDGVGEAGGEVGEAVGAGELVGWLAGTEDGEVELGGSVADPAGFSVAAGLTATVEGDVSVAPVCVGAVWVGVGVSVDDPEGAVEGEEVIKGVGDVAMLAGF